MWVSTHEEVRDHPKTRELMKMLKCSRQEAVGTLALLWIWGLRNADRDGHLTDASAKDIACGIMSRRNPKLLVSALVISAWLEVDGGEYAIHDWADWQKEWYAYRDKKEADRERKKAKAKG
jgi:hypothetical protein